MPPLTELYSNVGIAADPPLAAGISSSATTITFSSTTVVSQFPTAVAGTSQFRALLYEDTNADGVADKAELVLVTAGGAGSTSWTIQRAYEAIGGQQSTFAFTTAARVAPILASGGLANLPGVTGDFGLVSGRHLTMPAAYYPTAALGGAGSDWTLYSSGVTDPTRQADSSGIRPAVLRFGFTDETQNNQGGILIDQVHRFLSISTLPVTNTGSGYATPPAVAITAPDTGGVQAYAVAFLSGGLVIGVGTATSASVTAAVDQDGVITGLSALVGGANFWASQTGQVVVLEQNGNRSARATVNTSAGGVATSITLTTGGRGYVAGSVNISTAGLYMRTPTASFSGGGGSGAAANVVLTTVIRTALHIKSYTYPDNGGESSGLLVNSTGGSNAITGYRFSSHRPTGWYNWADSVQPAMEIGTNTGSIAGFFSSGAGSEAHTETCTTTDSPLTFGATTVNVNSTTGFMISSQSLKGYAKVEVGGVAVADICYTGMTSTSFTGVTWLTGSGTYAAGTTLRMEWASVGVMVRIDNGAAKGFLASPGDGVFNKRPAYAVAGHAHANHQHGTTYWQILCDGSQTGRNGYFSGVGQGTPYHGRSTDFGGVLTVNDTAGGVGDGGMIGFEAAGIPFAAIKAHLTDGNGYGQLKIGVRDQTAGSWNYTDSLIVAGQSGRTGGFVGIQVAPTALFQIGGSVTGTPAFSMSGTVTDFTASFFTPTINTAVSDISVISGQARVVPTAALAGALYGFLSIPTIGPSAGANNANTNNVFRVTNVYSATSMANTYGGVITEVMDYHAGGMSRTTGSTGTATTQYGYYCALLPTLPTDGPAQQSWGVYVVGRKATPQTGDRGNPSHFGDFVRCWSIEEFGTFVRYGVQVNRNAATVVVVGTILTATVTSGTAATFVSTANGGVLNIATTAVSANIASVVLSSFSQTQFQWGPVFTCNIQPVDITAVRIWAGLFQSAMTNADTPAAGNACAAFRFSTVASDTTWRAVTANATTATVATSVNSVTVAANTRYLLRVDCSDTVNARFFVNGLLVASTNTTIPPASTFLGMHLAIITQAATIKNLRFGGMWIAEE